MTSTDVPVMLTCDAPGCPARSRPAYSRAEARSFAKFDGWLLASSGSVLCARCSRPNRNGHAK